MKTDKTMFLSLIVFLLLSQPVKAMKGYFKGDTIWYKFDKVLLEITSTNAIQKNKMGDAEKERIKYVQKVIDEMSIVKPADDERIQIAYRDMGDDMYVWNYKELDLVYLKVNSKKLVVFDDGTTFSKDFGRYSILISYRVVEIKICVNDLADLNLIFEDSFDNKFELANKYLSTRFSKNYKKGIKGWLDLRESEVKGYFQDVSYKTNDMLILGAGVGGGFIKNQIVTSFGFRLGFSFGHKGIFRNAYFADYELLYDFPEDGSDKYKINGFLSLGYEHNFSRNPDKENWYGISLGYLVDRNNDIFGKNTVKVSVLKRINNSITILPEIYFDDFYKDGSPGLRVQITF